MRDMENKNTSHIPGDISVRQLVEIIKILNRRVAVLETEVKHLKRDKKPLR